MILNGLSFIILSFQKVADGLLTSVVYYLNENV